MEKVDEMHGNSGDFYAADYRSYDARLGRWLSQDPIVKPWESPYAGFANNPIYFVDPSGLDPAPGDPPPSNPTEGQKWTHVTSNGSEWFYVYDSDKGWVSDIDSDANSGNINMNTATVICDKETGLPISTTSDNENLFLDILRAGDAYVQGHTKWSWGLSQTGGNGENTHNPLAAQLEFGRWGWSVHKDFYDALKKASKDNPFIVHSYKGNAARNLKLGKLTYSRNTKIDPSKASQQKPFMSFPSSNGPTLGTRNAEEIYSDVQFTMLGGVRYVTLPIKPTATFNGTPSLRLYPANPHNIQLYRTGLIVTPGQLDLVTPAVQ